jgi:uncharacterized protein
MLPTREQALRILQANNCPPEVIIHCKAVAKLAKETAKSCQNRGVAVDVDLVEIGALLHDLGRAKTHSVNHVIVGAEIAQVEGLSETVIGIIKRHIGGGITDSEAKKLGWPKDNYMPLTIEEKIVSFADKLIGVSKRVPIETTINKLRKEKLNSAAARVMSIHSEISKLVNDP